jgi:peptidoglycan/LPS O-acetylase OafA/YrhL
MIDYPIGAIAAGLIVAYALATAVAGLVARADFPLPPAAHRIGCIDGLRGYLALSVLFHHFIIWMQVTRLGGGWTAPSVHFFNQLGAGGVGLFFMTTGLVFYPRVLAGFRAGAWAATYVGRIFRIVPLIAISVAIITTIIALRTGRGLDSAFPKAAAQWILALGEPSLLGYPDSGRINAYVLWSLWYEWIFYFCVMPACALAIDLIRGRFPSYVLPAVLLVASLAGRIAMPRSVFVFLPLFAIGMLAHEISTRENIARKLRTPIAAFIATGSLVFAMVFFGSPYDYALPMFAIFFVCVACGNSFGGILKTRGAVVLGECSYSIYILHGIVLSLLFVDAAIIIEAIPTLYLLGLLPFCAIIMTLLSPVSYLLVERPAVRIGRRIARFWTGRNFLLRSP